MQEPPKVTLVIPSYRRGAKILPTLESVAAQTRQPDEIIVVNDGGYPETTECVRRSFPAVKVLEVPHGGAPAARNYGAHAATSRVLMLLDDDDTLQPHAVETLLRVLTTFPEARAAYADHTYTNHITGEHFANHHSALPSFARLRAVTPVAIRDGIRLYDKRLYYGLLHGNLLQQPWMVYRDTYLGVGGFQPGLGSADDWDIYLRLTRTVPVAQTDEVIANHYVEVGKPHLTLEPQQLETQMEAIRRHIALAGWADPRAVVVLRRRLALYHKGFGDMARTASLAEAWRCYWRSFRCWPGDRVVAARLLLWPMMALFQRTPPLTPKGEGQKTTK